MVIETKKVYKNGTSGGIIVTKKLVDQDVVYTDEFTQAELEQLKGLRKFINGYLKPKDETN